MKVAQITKYSKEFHIAINEIPIEIGTEFISTWRDNHFFFVKSNGEQLQKLDTILESNHIKPALDSVYNFKQISQALDKVTQGHAQGKVVVTFE